MFKTVGKVWRYIKKYKKMLYIGLAAMLIVQVLSLIAPLIVKSIMDDYLIGIENTWYEVNDSGDNVVLFENKYYSQEVENDEAVSVVINQGKYYFVLDKVESGNKKIVYNEAGNNYELTITTQAGVVYNYSARLLTNSETKLFYGPFIEPLSILIILLALRFLLQILFSYIQRMAIVNININIVRDARKDAVASLQKMPIAYFEEEPAGKIANRIIHDVGGMMGLFSTLINLVLNASLSVIFAYIGMFYLDVKLALISFIIFPLIYLWLRVFVKSLNTIAVKVNEQHSLMTAQLNEIINGINILQIFNYEEETERTFAKLAKSHMNERLREVRLHLGLGWNMIRLLGSLVTALIVLYFGNGYLTIAGFTVTAGLIYAYNNYLTALIEPVSTLFTEIGNLQHSLVRTERIFRVIDGEQEDSTFNEIPRYKGDIKFENLWFSYKEGKPVLKDINLEITAGSMVGIVGHTGSGKSSLMNLLLRFYDLKASDMGHIYVDGININNYPKRTYRSHIGIILQDPIIFTGTIKSNVAFGKELSDEQVIEILISIGAKKLIDKLPLGIHEPLTRGGGNLSVGEKQLISFARVIAHDPSILIMDEATANIDTETESIIQKALVKVKEGRTLIIIAHRLSTIKKADKIVVLEAGIKIEEGSHSELLTLNRVYANMYRSQVKLNG
ncbi:MAG TPA: ABC transporter ATP-binding protein [Acholeplasmataceae bacterium]|nr:ABC transporter ATP-binding protein [Acholeplasmataceae bacterium]